ncbi:50S ribosomal protein L37e [Candidatus Woesearchaeota archaeon]|nr:50S ribosomal protein L37e [Candidatus Woesearchaeota archaeon]
MTKGQASMGKKSRKDIHILCRRCGKAAYHKISGICASCGYGNSAKRRSYVWMKPGKH